MKGDDKYQFENKNPFVQPEEESEVASVGYRYVLKVILCFFILAVGPFPA